MACEYNRRDLFNEAIKRGVPPNELNNEVFKYFFEISYFVIGKKYSNDLFRQWT